MLFHEIYGAYFRTVERILREAGTSGVTEKRMMEIIAEHAFAESTLVIPEKLQSGEWPLLKMQEQGASGSSGKKRYTSVLSYVPERPMTLLEKQWLKALLEDPRLRLFLYREEDRRVPEQLGELLADVPPLFERDTFEYYDRYSDGDDYGDPAYAAYFHQILRAIREKRIISLRYTSGRKNSRTGQFWPYGIEYSSKDDKFRVLCRSLRGTPYTINMSRIRGCEAGRPAEAEEMQLPEPRRVHVDLELTDERNALQRAMLHFSDLQKETERIDDRHYKVRLYYYHDDETEIVIRILSFGPMLRVTAPERMIRLIRERIEKQAATFFP